MSLELSTERHDDYIELKWSGPIHGGVLPQANPFDALPDGTRVLVDVTGLTIAGEPAFRWSNVAWQAAMRQLKVGVLSPPGLIFGLCRQALLTAGVDEEYKIALFLNREQAIVWLTSDGRAASSIRSEA